MSSLAAVTVAIHLIIYLGYAAEAMPSPKPMNGAESSSFDIFDDLTPLDISRPAWSSYRPAWHPSIDSASADSNAFHGVSYHHGMEEIGENYHGQSWHFYDNPYPSHLPPLPLQYHYQDQENGTVSQPKGDHGDSKGDKDSSAAPKPSSSKRAPNVSTEYYKHLKKYVMLPRVLQILREKTPSYSVDVIQRHVSKRITKKIADQILSRNDAEIEKAQEALHLTYPLPCMKTYTKQEIDAVLKAMVSALNLTRPYIRTVLAEKGATKAQMDDIKAAIGDENAIRDLAFRHFRMGPNVYSKAVGGAAVHHWN
ncbi:hypothetical protein CBS101457_000286 [Exobasidium rhododendri]|nr:hypothetical protein CBS101457_000286 [Exobasidium rhododendri]